MNNTFNTGSFNTTSTSSNYPSYDLQDRMRKVMSFDEYQRMAVGTAIFPKEKAIYYLPLGIAGEAGEICEKIKKHIREGKELDKNDLKFELGDLLWYISVLANSLEISLSDIAESNIEKLNSRKERGVLQGSGDER